MNIRENRWKIKEQIIVLNRLGMLLERGYSLNDGLEFLQFSLTKDKRIAITRSAEKLKNGSPFYRVLEDLKFHPLAVSFVFYAEKYGNLAASLQTVSLLLLKRKKEEDRIKKILAYPIFLLCFTFIIFFVILNELLPQFMYMYHTFSSTPNFFIRFFYWVQQHFNFILIYIFLFFLFLIFIFHRYKKRKNDIEIQLIVAKIPVFGRLYQLWQTYYLSYHISQLLKNGISLMECFKFIEKDPKKNYLKSIIQNIQKKLMAGYQLEQAINTVPIWEKQFGQVIFHGQLTGKLEIELEAYSQTCMEQFFEKVEKMIRIAQPVIFGFIALWVIFMYISIMLPTFEVINNL